ncbi:MAG: ABC transporter substrate-binding protein [Patescibacteria group bacterium]|jgi:ABC-type amino acid transport substrate-binding protein
MKKKNTFFVVLTVLVIATVVGAWLWYGNFKTADSSLADIKKREVLKVGSNLPFGVMERFDENNKPVGIDIDIAQEIASRLGVTLELNNYGWDELFTAVKSGEVDLAISSITITPERQKEVFFSRPYFNGGQVIVALSDNQEIKGIADLEDRKIAAQKDTTGYNEAKRYTSASLIYPYLNFDKINGSLGIIDDLRSGKFDVIIVDYIQALDMIKEYPGLKIVGVPFTKENYGIITKIGNESLMQKINSILQDIGEDGALEKIEAKWIKL